MDEVEEFLKHHGVKGMKWGIRKQRDHGGEGSGNSDVQRLLRENPLPTPTAEQARRIKENKAKFDAKFRSDEEPSTEKKGHWSPTPKQKVLIAAGAVATAGILIALAAKKAGVRAELKKSFSLEDYQKVAMVTESPEWLHKLKGTTMSGDDFAGLVKHTEGRIWGSEGYVTKESFVQKEVRFAAGHQFYRLSHNLETSFGPRTYATASTECLHRYMSTFGGSKLIKFKAKSEIRVPDLHTRLEAMRKALAYSGKTNLTPAEVLGHYDDRSGGGWNDSLSKKFFHVLKEEGYHAIVDDMDAGIYGELPLVFFDHEPLTSKVATELSLKEKLDLSRQVVELANRR